MFVGRDQETLFHFVFSENLELLPASESIQANGVSFQTYGSDELNLVAWQYPDDEAMGFLVGRISVLDLAQLAGKSLQGRE